VLPQQNEGKLDDLLKEVAETSPGPETPNEEFNGDSPIGGTV